MRKRLITAFTALSVFMALPAPTLAGETDSMDPKLFADWFTLGDVLKSKHNINVTYVNWQVIEPMCLPLKTEDSDVNYNKCRYEKAVLMNDFQTDSGTCNQQSVLKLPDSLKTNPSVSTVTITDRNGVPKTIQKTFPPYSDSDLRNARSSVYFDCMLGMGWKSPNDWTSGRRY